MIVLAIICTSVTFLMHANLILKDENMKTIEDPKSKAERIIKRVSKATGVTVEELKSKTRKRVILVPRQVAQYLIYCELKGKMTLKEMGGLFGKDHATIIHSYKEVKRGIETKDAFVMPIIEALKLNQQKIAA